MRAIVLWPLRQTVLSLRVRSLLMADVVICYTTALLGFIVRDSFVVILGVLGYDVPCVEEAREVAEDAEEDVDERVGGAEAGFDPNCNGWEEDGDETQEDIAARHGGFVVVIIDDAGS